jgi:hypothetical protein
VPGAAHEGDALEVPLRRAHRLAHVRLAARLHAGDGATLPQLGHRLFDALKEAAPVLPLLDLALPPQLAILVAGGLGEEPQRIVPQIVFALALAHAMGLRQIDEAHRDALLQRVAERLPLGGEDRQRVEDRLVRYGARIDQERDGRLHLRVREERDERVAFGRTFDQHDVGRELLQRGAHASSAARSVMADAEEVQAQRRSMQAL